MSGDIDLPPLYDKITKESALPMSDVYRDWLAAFVQTISSYLSASGIMLPQMTIAQRETIKNPINGQVIYNVDDNTAQYFKNGDWVSF